MRPLNLIFALLLVGCSDKGADTDSHTPSSDDTGTDSVEDTASDSDTTPETTDDTGNTIDTVDTVDTEPPDTGPPPADADGDGYTTAENDCDDSDPTVLPVTFEGSDGVITDVSPELVGLLAAPARYTVAEPGTLRFCEGTWYVNLTVEADDVYVVGRGEESVLHGADTDSVLSATFASGLHLSGLTLTRGLGDDGGGAKLVHSEVLIADVLFLENDTVRTSDFGGGLYADDDSEIWLERVTFEANQAGYGGGARISYSTATLIDVDFIDNDSRTYGGGLLLSSTNAVLDGVQLTGNHTGSLGGGAYFSYGRLTLIDVTIDGNDADDGGGLYIASRTSLTLDNSAITNNIATETGGGVNTSSSANLTFTDVTVSGNEAPDGGGIYQSYGGALAWDGGALADNTAAIAGGGLHISADISVNLTDVAITGNVAPSGGGVYFDESLLNCVDCDLLDNDPDDLYHGDERVSYDWDAKGVTFQCEESGCVSSDDADGDGYSPYDGDCDDDPATGAEVYPGADEICDTIDNDCDGLIDGDDDSVDLSTASTWYADGDGDGHGDPDSATESCGQPDGYVSDDTDTDDADPLTYPGAEDIDDDGDGYTDVEGDTDDGDPLTYPGAEDIDDDGDGYTDDEGDTDDGAASVYPGASEVCDGVQNDSDAASWSAAEEAGMATFFDVDGAAADWTATLSGPGVTLATVSDSGTLWICEGDWTVALTIAADDVSVMGSGEGVTALDGENSEVVITADGVLGLHIEGLTITRGESPAYSDGYGGGVSLIDSEAALVNVTVSLSDADYGCGVGMLTSEATFEGVTFSGNNCSLFLGGGLYLKDSSATVSDAVFTNNEAAGGAGIYLEDSALVVTDSTFDDNDCAAHTSCEGGGLMVVDSEAELSDVTLSNNDVLSVYSSSGGGGMYVYNDSAVSLTDVVFSNNSDAYGGGGGLYIESSSVAMLRADFDGNSAGYGGGGVFLDSGGEVTGEDCDFSDNDPNDLQIWPSGDSYELGEGADFSCDESGC